MEQIASINYRNPPIFKTDVKHLVSNVSLIYREEIKDSEFVKLQKCISNVYYDKPLNNSCEDLYRSVENLCTINQYEDLYNDLHVLIKEYLYLQVLEITCYTDCHFLHKLKELWLNYCHKSKLVKNVYLYLESYSVRHGKKKISVWNMCVELFQNVVLSNELVENKLNYIFTLIENERNGATIDIKLIKDIICMLDKLAMYETHFEPNFINKSEFYYERRRDQLLAGNNILQYIDYVQLKLKEESMRVNLYLKASTEKALIKNIYVVLIDEELDLIFEKLEKFEVFHKADQTDLLHLYDLLVIHPKANTQLCEIFSKYMMQKGCRIIFDERNDKMLIPNLLDFKNHIDEIVRVCFKNTQIYVEAVRTSFKKFINQRKNRPAQYLAKFINSKMREKMIPEELLDKIMVLFRYIHGKDVFEAYYKRYLSKRLLVGQSSSQDAEKYMIGKLKLECGDGFTSKLEGMFKDIDLSVNLMCAFKQRFTSEAFPIEFGANVLTSSFWPTYTKYTVTLSDKMANYQTIFHDFYKSKYTGRSLQWLPALGSCVLKAALNTKKEFVVSLFQALVLCLFNENDRLTYKSIKLNLNIDKSELDRTLVSLFCKQVQLLIKDPPHSKIFETDEYYINEEYTHKLYRIKINQLQLKETEQEHKITEEEVLHDRHLQIDAALVRLMKQNKKMRHIELISEMYNILKFPINPNDIKKRIEILIERDYLSRNPDDTNSYYYVA